MTQTVQQLRQAGHSLREISRLLSISRNSVRKLIKQTPAATHEPPRRETRHEEYLPIIQTLLAECRGNLVRVYERLQAEHGISFAYSTLT
jgi:transposase